MLFNEWGTVGGLVTGRGVGAFRGIEKKGKGGGARCARDHVGLDQSRRRIQRRRLVGRDKY